MLALGRGALVAAFAVALAACSGSGGDPAAVPPLPEATPDTMAALLTQADRPVLVNIWASWCVPCRSEAPLLREAHARFGDEVRFVGVAVRDRQEEARAFLDEFDLAAFEHLFNPAGDIPARYGGRGVPITFFFAPGGELRHRHNGVIDERTLAVQLDDLVRGG